MVSGGKIKAFGGRGHGNGGVPTASEKEGARILSGLGFEPELVVPTHQRTPKYYRIDLAHRAAMVAVEIDGSSHSPRARRASDERKDSFLRSVGWEVLRFRDPVDFEEVRRRCEQLVLTRVPSGT